MKNEEFTDKQVEKLIKDQKIEIYVLDDVTLAVKRQDRIEKQWTFTQLDTLIQIHNRTWNCMIAQTIKKERPLPFQPICETKIENKQNHVTIMGDIFKTNPGLIFGKHKFMKKFLRKASKQFAIPFGYALRNPVDEPDNTTGEKRAVERLLTSFHLKSKFHANPR